MKIHTVFALENPTRPSARGDGVAAIHADHSALQIFRFLYPGVYVVEAGPMVKVPGDENRDRGDRPAVRFGAEIGGERHLANVELEIADHAPHACDRGIDRNMLQLQTTACDAAVLQRSGHAIIADRNRERAHSN